jgi:hypothetical protein
MASNVDEARKLLVQKNSTDPFKLWAEDLAKKPEIYPITTPIAFYIFGGG